MTGYVAPARYALTVLHIEDPDAHRRADLFAPERVDGWTRCGLPFLGVGVVDAGGVPGG